MILDVYFLVSSSLSESTEEASVILRMLCISVRVILLAAHLQLLFLLYLEDDFPF